LWGEPIGSRSWSFCGFLYLFFLSYLSIALVPLVGFEWEGIWALRVSLPLHRLHRFEFSSEIRWWKVCWDFYSWVLGTLDG
jgi:hypothetical protein